MNVVQQRTIKNPIHCRGIGLHSGVKTSMTLHPAAPNSGVVFRRTDAGGAGAEIAAQWRNVVESSLCTTLSNGEGITIGTVEHLMAALAGAEIDNALVELDGPEVPIMDGSAAPFVFLIECAGVVEQDAARRAIRILKKVTVGDSEKSATLMPDDGFSMSFEIDFASRVISRQDLSIVFDSDSFKSEISRARTFGLLHEVDRLRAAGLARGGSLDNSVVVNGDTILNEGGLRYADEFVRHKLLDAVGDLYLAGGPLIGHFRGERSGHLLNRKLLEALFATPGAWCFTTLSRGDAIDAVIWGERNRATA
ncbi:MAG TPA: UDP-3-O-acyl-N-acetylglucosamine deacetylase [Stellaceae bacterium]|jgi:UDP-3-O-[3-hydroxymyristoyl] N-acetylglucosamine deacetylase|nr:UDP-3-O-acyl-N-acetylglucosamine deacetylase [Stellaceae bacterium]